MRKHFFLVSMLAIGVLFSCTKAAKKAETGQASLGQTKKECAHILPPLCKPNEQVVMEESYTGCLAPRCKAKEGCAAVQCAEPERCLPGETLEVTAPIADQCCPTYACRPAGSTKAPE